MAARTALTLLDDKRFIAFAKRYAFDLARFAIEVFGVTPTWQQLLLFASVQKPGSRTSVSSGHGTGKTAAFAIIALWHLLCYHGSNTFLTGPKLGTIQQGVWKEFADLQNKIKAGACAWVADYFTVEHERVYVNGHKLNWFVMPKTAPRGTPENLAGTHRTWLLWLADEASGIPDANFGVIGGALTDERNRFCLASQPTRSSGFFYDTHHRLATDAGGPWTPLVFNSEESPLVSDNFIRDKLIEYGGEESVEYQIKVQGRFPENQDGFLLGRKQVEARIGAEPVIMPGEAYGNLLLVDVGAGEYRDKSVAVHARVIGSGDIGAEARRADVVDVPIFTNTRNIEDFTGEVFQLASRISNCTVLVDAGGMGVAVCQKLEALGVVVVRVRWGNPCWSKKLQERFFNQRAAATVLCAKAIKDGRMSLPRVHTKDLLDQATRLPYHFDEKARYVIMKKEDMREEGIPSPDLFDALAFIFLESATYTVAESGLAAGAIAQSTHDALAGALDAALADA